MKAAAREAYEGLRLKSGGPFGAVIIRKGGIIARGHNQVTSLNDPTAHAEMQAIRRASRILGRFDLSDCEIYSSCEPCPMCLAAIFWARIKKVYYGCTKKDAERIGFDDNLIYDILRGKKAGHRLRVNVLGRKDCLGPFRKWAKDPAKKHY